MLKHYPVNYSASGTSAKTSQMFDPAGGENRWRQYFQSSTKVFCSSFTVRAVSEITFYLSETVMWHPSLCICEYNVYICFEKSLYTYDDYLGLFTCITTTSLKIEVALITELTIVLITELVRYIFI